MVTERGSTAVAAGAESQTAARELAVVLHDLGWLLPRTIGLAAARQEPLPASELEVMRLLVRRPGLSVNDVARELGLQPSNASTAIRLLIARGTLERRQDSADARVARLFPTAAAYAARDRREQSWGEQLTGVLARLPAADRAQLTAAAPALRRLAAELADDTPTESARRPRGLRALPDSAVTSLATSRTGPSAGGASAPSGAPGPAFRSRPGWWPAAAWC